MTSTEEPKPPRRRNELAFSTDDEIKQMIASGQLGFSGQGWTSNGADVLTRVHCVAACPGREELLVYLLDELRDDVNARNKLGETPLGFLIVNNIGNYAAMRILINRGADVNIDDNNRDSSVHSPLLFYALRDPVAFRILVKADDSDLVIRDRERNTLDQCALLSGNYKAIQILKENNAIVACDTSTVCKLFDKPWHIVGLIEADCMPPLAWEYLGRVFEFGTWHLYMQTFTFLWLAGNDFAPATEFLRGRFATSRVAAARGIFEHNFFETIERRVPEFSKLIVFRRAIAICEALYELQLPALMLYEILQEHFGHAWPMIPMHLFWEVIVTVKHFHDADDHPAKKRRLKK